jgi:hypothetical protein
MSDWLRVLAALTIIAAASGQPAHALPQPNDTCAGATEITSGGTSTGSNIGALDDYRSRDGQGNGPDVVFTFELEEQSRVTMDLDGSGFFVDAYIRTECDNVSSEVAFEDWLGGNGAAVQAVLPPFDGGPPLRANLSEGRYWLILDTQGAASVWYKYGDYRLRFDTSPFERGDRCETAHSLALGDSVTGDTTALVDDTTHPGLPAGGIDVVYRLSLTSQTSVHVNMIGSTFDTVLFIRTVCDDPSSAIAFNDDAAPDIWHSELEVTLTAGDYYVIVDGWDHTAFGEYILEVVL